MSLARLLGFVTLPCSCVVGRYRELATNRDVMYVEEKGEECTDIHHRRNYTIPPNSSRRVEGKMTKVLWALVCLLLAASAQAQVLTTADTLGAGKNAVMASENALALDGIQINIAYVMYVRGLTSSVDLCLSVGETHLLGQGQVWAGVGGNAHLGKIAGNSISLFGVVSLPLTGREVGSAVLVNLALVVSRSLTDKVSVYSGINVLIPIGELASRFFTPPDTKANVPVGVSVILGNWGLTAEADFGKLKALGIALSRTF